MFPLVDVDGLTKPTVQIIAEEALDAGIEELCIVTAPGDEETVPATFPGPHGGSAPRLRGQGMGAPRVRTARAYRAGTFLYVTQSHAQKDTGMPSMRPSEWVGDEPFLLLLGDHVYISSDPAGRRCGHQVVRAFEGSGQSVSAVKRTPERMLHLFGTVKGEPLDQSGLYRVRAMVEKPSPERAERDLRTPGLRSGDYLCFFGMHVFTPAIFDCLGYNIEHDIRERGEFQLTAAQAMLAEREPYLASRPWASGTTWASLRACRDPTGAGPQLPDARGDDRLADPHPGRSGTGWHCRIGGPMSALVTGGAGFIGSHLVRALLAAGEPVTVLDNMKRGNPAGLPREVRLLEGDIRDPSTVATAIEGCDVVYHLAAQSNVLGAVSDIDYSFTTNVVGTYTLLAAARGWRCGGWCSPPRARSMVSLPRCPWTKRHRCCLRTPTEPVSWQGNCIAGCSLRTTAWT